MNLYMLIHFQRETLPMKNISASSLKHTPNTIQGTRTNKINQAEIKIKIGIGSGIFMGIFFPTPKPVQVNKQKCKLIHKTEMKKFMKIKLRGNKMNCHVTIKNNMKEQC